MGPVKGLNIFWRVLNAEKNISEGDVLIGAAVFYLKSETKVKSVSVKVKAEARVEWTFSDVHYVGYRRYFKDKEYLIAPQNRAIELAKGLHRLDFVLRIPEGDFPSSFRGDYGSIVYALEVKISRTWLRTSSITAELYFLSKSYALFGGMRSRQSDSVDKKVGIFSKGQVNMRVTADKKCSKGEVLYIVAHISNMSSKKVTPKFKLIQTTTYKVKDQTNIVPLTVRSAIGNPVQSGSEASVGCQLSVPDDISYSIHNCSILRVWHTIKVSLDISFAFDPTVLLPLDIIPAKYLSPPDDSDAGPSAAPPAAPHLE
ncbi:arrestin domain-containing protein 3-like isoform 2-T2 [Synchiropus picturatus]